MDGRVRMTRRQFAAGAGMAAAGLAPADHARLVTHPNVLVFFTDQQRWDTCGCYAATPLKLTPNLDRMARRGVLLRNSFTCQPVCGPARGCLQTGLYATQHGVWRNGLALPASRKTLAHHFRDAGYTTAYIGKWHLGGTGDKPVPRAQQGGYDYWLAADAIELMSHPYDFRAYDRDGKLIHRPGYRVDAQTDCVLDYLRDRARAPEQPFFLFASYLEPHHQNDMNHFVAPEGTADRYREKLWVPPDLRGLKGDWEQELPDYYGMVARLDENLGRVLAELKRLHMDRNTVVLFASDHGCHFRTRNSEYKRSCHEASIRVPTVFQGPGFDRRAVVESLVSIPDWTATLLDAAGIQVPAEMMGQSILPLLRGEAVDWPEEVFIQISESQVGRAIRTARWKYGVTAPNANGNVQAQADRYVEQYLYDLRHDPAEHHNLIGKAEYRTIADDLMATLKRRMIAAGEAEPQIEAAPPVGPS